MQRHPDYTRTRLKQLAERIWRQVYSETQPIDDLLISPRVDRISYDQAQQLTEWRPAKLGDQLGPLWATFWVKARVSVPDAWRGRRVDLLWSSRSEATLWRDGRSLQGLNAETWSAIGFANREDAVLLPKSKGGEVLEFQIEIACNQLFGYEADLRAPMRGIVSPYVLERADIALFDPDAWDLYFDFITLQQLEAEQTTDLDKAWGGLLLAELNTFANTYDPADRSTWAPARKILTRLYKNRNATVTHELSAIGHAHIDTAWLWPLAETHRKCERSFSSAVTYMDQYPEFTFACSQAYQYQAIADRNPDLYQRIKDKVAAGQFVPVGGTWIEPDCNIPSGEALVRQFTHGQRFFEKEFGLRCKEFWNPDVFGYNGQLPQICNGVGIHRFLTQKLSWNRFNKPHHHTFIWEGIDGSEVFTHFPPADTYNADPNPKLLRDNARHYKDHDRSRHSLMLFGYGDGGGGPTKRMLETLRRVGDLQGLPRTQIRSSDEFFSLLEKDNTDRVRLIGELYFEYHRGTYTTQAATKRGNRKTEIALHDVEFLSVLAGRTAHAAYPSAVLDELWKTLLLNQFHDILPGSSIKLVYEDAERDFAQLLHKAEELCTDNTKALFGEGSERAIVNTIGFARSEVVDLGGGRLAYVQAPSYGFGAVTPSKDQVTLTTQSPDLFVIENAQLRATLTSKGDLTSLVEKSTGREALAGPGNQLLLYDDHPTDFDAWDVDPFHMEQERVAPPADACEVTESGPLRAALRFTRQIGRASKMTQEVRLRAGGHALEFHNEVDWQEDHQMLKVAFPVQVRAMNATYEMQFGVAERPTHFNTMYDLARYEVPGHRWSDLSEPEFGVSLLSESKYGYSTFGNVMRLSLLRAPTFPDPTADRGRHAFAFAIFPHAGGWREAGTVQQAMAFNIPLRLASAKQAPAARSFASVDRANLVLDTIKKAEDSDATILRLYETHGARGTAALRVDLPFTSATFVNLLEEGEVHAERTADGIVVPYRPFQIITLKLA